jgi:excisionase family DNA binding protein/PAS domain S-box-containing protein
MEKTLFSTPELAELLGVFHTTIRRWIERGRIKGIRVGRNYKIPADEVIRVLSDHNLPLPEALRKHSPESTDEGPSTAHHHPSVLEKLLIVEDIGDPAVICRNQAIICANKPFADLLGYSQADLIGQDVAEVIDGAFREGLSDLAQNSSGHPDQGPAHYEAQLKTGGMKKKVRISVSSLKHLPDALLLIIKE